MTFHWHFKFSFLFYWHFICLLTFSLSFQRFFWPFSLSWQKTRKRRITRVNRRRPRHWSSKRSKIALYWRWTATETGTLGRRHRRPRRRPSTCSCSSSTLCSKLTGDRWEYFWQKKHRICCFLMFYKRISKNFNVFWCFTNEFQRISMFFDVLQKNFKEFQCFLMFYQRISMFFNVFQSFFNVFLCFSYVSLTARGTWSRNTTVQTTRARSPSWWTCHSRITAPKRIHIRARSAKRTFRRNFRHKRRPNCRPAPSTFRRWRPRWRSRLRIVSNVLRLVFVTFLTDFLFSVRLRLAPRPVRPRQNVQSADGDARPPSRAPPAVPQKETSVVTPKMAKNSNIKRFFPPFF